MADPPVNYLLYVSNVLHTALVREEFPAQLVEACPESVTIGIDTTRFTDAPQFHLTLFNGTSVVIQFSTEPDPGDGSPPRRYEVNNAVVVAAGRDGPDLKRQITDMVIGFYVPALTKMRIVPDRVVYSDSDRSGSSSS